MFQLRTHEKLASLSFQMQTVVSSPSQPCGLRLSPRAPVPGFRRRPRKDSCFYLPGSPLGRALWVADASSLAGKGWGQGR